jgi:hypothetical protein
MTKFEWASNQHRDTIASHIGHYDMLSFFAVAQNDSIGRVRYQLLEVCTRKYCPSERFIRKCSSPVVLLQQKKMMMRK